GALTASATAVELHRSTSVLIDAQDEALLLHLARRAGADPVVLGIAAAEGLLHPGLDLHVLGRETVGRGGSATGLRRHVQLGPETSGEQRAVLVEHRALHVDDRR